ncbi:MAG TPA: ribonuclease III [Terriglobia bacterium]|nr:ribonuclease III [Terriglobia bacterium]
MGKPSIETLQKAIGYEFRHAELLFEALTHSSYARESVEPVKDNEQFEFLGDAILGFVVSVKLADAFPQYPEGKLSRGRSRLVAAEHLSKVAAQLGLGKYLRLGRGEEKTGGRFKARLAVNALEALAAAIYRDGGLAAAERFISEYILPPDLVAVRNLIFSVDYKSALQERLQAAKQGVALYRIVEEAGPEHRKTFVVEVRALGQAARGSGESKKVAEQEAARILLELIEGKPVLNG